MAKRIYKYEIEPARSGQSFLIELPAGAKIVMVGTQVNDNDELIYCWAEVDVPATLVEDVRFVVVGTGQAFPLTARHVGSVSFQLSRLVFHIYRLDPGCFSPRYA
jgi:hypothetical protein